MYESAADNYKKIRAATSGPGDVLLALYDGLFRFLKLGLHHLEAHDRGQASQAICKAHSIVSELQLALDHAVAPELCIQLESIYGFCMDRLTTANLKANPKAVEEVIRVLTPLREAWKAAVPLALREGHAGIKRAV